jgi:hypothetical protein
MDWRSGYWIAWSVQAYNISQIENITERKYEKEFLARRIGMDIIYFPCEICKPHALEYLRQNPFKPYLENKDPLSMFIYVWKFHNYVNRRLNKKELSLTEALEAWKGKCDKCEIVTPEKVTLSPY